MTALSRSIWVHRALTTCLSEYLSFTYMVMKAKAVTLILVFTLRKVRLAG